MDLILLFEHIVKWNHYGENTSVIAKKDKSLFNKKICY